MVHVLKSKIAIVGAGPAGCACAYYLQNDYEVTLFDYASALRTLLPTGGGRCNLAYGEYDFKDLAKNYPRGEKFLYSVFSKFSTADTLAFFENIGVETYMQDDFRIFPKSNSAKDVREKFLDSINKVRHVRENVLRVDRVNYLFKVVTDLGSYNFDKVIIATGGHASYEIMKILGHKIVEPKPALVGLKSKENLSELAGVALKNASAEFPKGVLSGDFLFTHQGVSGPLVYQISSIMAKEKFPYNIEFNFVGEIDLQTMLNENSQKSIKNILSELVPKSFACYVLDKLKIDEDKKAHKIDGKMRDEILNLLQKFMVTIFNVTKDGEVVTCGGVDLAEINPKTLESKIQEGIYFCGEVLDIDGFCGGFNLQNCWSSAYVVSQSISQ
ncbi:MAG: aminoacetone oxidase family FAD-binding enzyme [Candidatus Gastranaerophilales bacterium]